MSISRIVYFSENAIEPSQRDQQITELQKVAVRRNRRSHVTGALVYDDRWFAQALEGEIQFVEEILGGIMRDPRHDNVTIISKSVAPERMFKKWSMGFAERTLKNEPLFGLHWFSAARPPGIMSENNLLKLMTELSRQGFMGSEQNVAQNKIESDLAK